MILTAHSRVTAVIEPLRHVNEYRFMQEHLIFSELDSSCAVFKEHMKRGEY
jgi:hypothetical protein